MLTEILQGNMRVDRRKHRWQDETKLFYDNTELTDYTVKEGPRVNQWAFGISVTKPYVCEKAGSFP